MSTAMQSCFVLSNITWWSEFMTVKIKETAEKRVLGLYQSLKASFISVITVHVQWDDLNVLVQSPLLSDCNFSATATTIFLSWTDFQYQNKNNQNNKISWPFFICLYYILKLIIHQVKKITVKKNHSREGGLDTRSYTLYEFLVRTFINQFELIFLFFFFFFVSNDN